MIGRGKKNGRQINQIDTKVQEIIETLSNSPQSTPHKPVSCGLGSPGYETRSGFSLLAISRKPVRKDLIEDGVTSPGNVGSGLMSSHGYRTRHLVHEKDVGVMVQTKITKPGFTGNSGLEAEEEIHSQASKTDV